MNPFQQAINSVAKKHSVPNELVEKFLALILRHYDCIEEKPTGLLCMQAAIEFGDFAESRRIEMVTAFAHFQVLQKILLEFLSEENRLTSVIERIPTKIESPQQSLPPSTLNI